MERHELYAATEGSKRVRFPASGLTWMAIRADRTLHIKLVAGHTSFDVTEKYVAAAGAADLLPGETAFPMLPESLSKSHQSSHVRKAGRP